MRSATERRQKERIKSMKCVCGEAEGSTALLCSPRERAPAARTVHGHLVDLGGVVLLDVPQDADVVVLHKVDGHTFPAVPA